MAINFANVVNWTIPEGDCVKVLDSTGAIIWQKDTYTDMDYVTCKDAFTGIIVPISIPVGSTYEIMSDTRCTSWASARKTAAISGGISGTSTYGWGFYEYYDDTWNQTENVYWNGTFSEGYGTSVKNRWSSTSYNTSRVRTTLKNDGRSLFYPGNSSTSNKSDAYSNWNSASAVNGWWGFCLFATGENTWNTTSNQRFIGEIYGCSIKVDNEYIYNFKPVMRDRDGVFGLYDTVNNKFYPSCTSNPFTHEVVLATNLSIADINVALGSTASIRRTITPSNATTKALSWVSSRPEIASVNNSGVVSGIALGSCTVTATTTDGTNISDSCNVRVYKPSTGVTLSDYDITLDVGEIATITGTVVPSDAYYQYVYYSIDSQSTSDVISISKNENVCTITGLAVGTARVKAYTIDGDYAMCNVTVIAGATHVTGITLNSASISLERGDSYQLTPTITPSDATNKTVSWTTSDDSVATVNSNGNVTAVNAGSCTITCTTQDRGYTASCTVTVPTHKLTINTTPSDATVAFNSAVSSDKFINVAKGITVYYEVSKEGYGTEVGSYTMGTTDHVINVTLTSGSIPVSNVTITPSTSLIGTSATFAPHTVQLTANVLPDQASVKSVNWVSSNTDIATVDSNGLVTSGNTAGSVIITATATDGSGCTANATVNVAHIRLNQTSANLIVGQTLQLSATVTPTLSYTWASSDTSKATVDSNGLVTAVGVATSSNPVYIYCKIGDTNYTINPCEITIGPSVDPTVKYPNLFNNNTVTAYYVIGNDINPDTSLKVALAPGGRIQVEVHEGQSLYVQHVSSGVAYKVTTSYGSTYTYETIGNEELIKIPYADIVDNCTITLQIEN